MDKPSASGAKFGFGDANTQKDEQKKDNVQSPVNEEQSEQSIAAVEEPISKESKEELEDEYTDVRSVTISLVTNYSLYRKANSKVLPQRKDFIGSCVTSSRVLSSNREEIETYFPNIVGLAPNNENFITRVKQWLNNIRVGVDSIGKTLNTSFRYYHKKDYYKIKKEEEKIEYEFSIINRQDIEKLKAGIKDKINKLNVLESSKCKLGYPINVEEYLIYRHCLLYNDVAKDISLINVDPNIRFYFKDDNKEADKLRKHRISVNKAKQNYVNCVADDNLFKSIYIQYCVANGIPVIPALAESRIDQEVKLDKFSSEQPDKFNKMFGSKDVKLIGDIELFIARGILVRSEYNQNITTPDGDFIGANMNEAVAWFKKVENTSIVNSFYNQLNNI